MAHSLAVPAADGTPTSEYDCFTIVNCRSCAVNCTNVRTVHNPLTDFLHSDTVVPPSDRQSRRMFGKADFARRKLIAKGCRGSFGAPALEAHWHPIGADTSVSFVGNDSCSVLEGPVTGGVSALLPELADVRTAPQFRDVIVSLPDNGRRAQISETCLRPIVYSRHHWLKFKGEYRVRADLRALFEGPQARDPRSWDADECDLMFSLYLLRISAVGLEKLVDSVDTER